MEHLRWLSRFYQFTEPLQSAYKSFHSCETALLRVQNDILLAIDNRHCVMLLLLDLSAAFDTVDHVILLKRLNSKFSIRGTALDWFRSYLTNRTQVVLIDGRKSQSRELKCGVPQGSVLGPILYLPILLPTFYVFTTCNFISTPMILSCTSQQVWVVYSFTTWGSSNGNSVLREILYDSCV